MRITATTALLAATLVTASPALAGTRSITFAPSSLGSPTPIMLFLPNDQTRFVPTVINLPIDYKRNSVAKLKLKLVNQGSACVMKLGAGFYRARAGKPIVAGATGLSGIGDKSVTFAANAMRIKTYTISPVFSGSIQGQRAGDTVTVEFLRDFVDPADTCEGIGLLGAEFIYKTR